MVPRGRAGRVAHLGALVVVLALALALAPPALADFEFLAEWGTPKLGELIQPYRVERDSAGNTYVVDIGRPSVQEFDSAGSFVRSFGSYGANGSVPLAVAVDPISGDLYVSVFSGFDSMTPNSQIQRFDSSGNLLSTFGSYGTDAGQFSNVNGLAVDPDNGDLYVADTGNHRIQKLDAGGAFLRMWGRDVNPANPSTGFEFCTGGCKRGEPGVLKGEFDQPSDIAVDPTGAPNTLYVSDQDNNRIQKFDSNGSFQLMAGRDVVDGNAITGAETCAPADVCKTGVPGSGDGELDSPQAVDLVFPGGSLLIADGDNFRVQRWDAALAFVMKFGSQGDADGQFQFPGGIAEASGRIVVADPASGRLQRFNLAGAFQTRIGDPAPNTLVFPLFSRFGSGGIAAGSGGIYVDDERNRVLRFDTGGGFQGSWGSSGTATGKFNIPRGISTDPAGNVFVADSGNSRIQKFDSAGTALATWGSLGDATGQFDFLTDVAVSTDGAAVFTTDTTRVQKFSPIGGFLGTWGAGGTADGQFSSPQGIATDSGGNVYVVDASNDRVQKFDANGNFITAWGSHGTGDGQFDSPLDVAIDPLGNVFVVDRDNNRIQRFDSAGNFLGRFGANGGDGTAGSGPGEFRDPIGIAVDASADIYVLDRDNSRVEKFAHATASPPGGPAVPDLTLTARKRQKPGRLTVAVACGGAPCTVGLSGKVTARATKSANSRAKQKRKAGRFARKLKPSSLTLAAGETTTVRLKLKRARPSLHAVTALLAGGGHGTATINATATNPAGTDTAGLKLKLKRP